MSATSCWRSEDVIIASRAHWEGVYYEKKKVKGGFKLIDQNNCMNLFIVNHERSGTNWWDSD